MGSTQGNPIITNGEVTRPLMSEAEVRQQRRDKQAQALAGAQLRQNSDLAKLRSADQKHPIVYAEALQAVVAKRVEEIKELIFSATPEATDNFIQALDDLNWAAECAVEEAMRDTSQEEIERLRDLDLI